jgi:hypothetical protein
LTKKKKGGFNRQYGGTTTGAVSVNVFRQTGHELKTQAQHTHIHKKKKKQGLTV